ncbi:MAG: 4-hydroxybenzoate octaprenyltransferase [Pseudomonadota bacterium]
MPEPKPTPPARPGDAIAGGWVDGAPRPLRPYLRLARVDRPIGTWLLLWPCWWSLMLAQVAAPGKAWLPNPWLMALFALGALVMRGAGCTYNDILDRDFDAQVARTRGRPLPAGDVTLAQAWAFALAQALAGLVILLQFNGFTIALGLASLAIVAFYPFAKRITHWPQAVLGLAFNWGALMGWAAVNGRLDGPAFLLYGAGVAWTLGYDTIYAHQDKEDDALIGVKSTARLLGARTPRWLAGFYGVAAALLALAVWLAGGGWLGVGAMAAASLHLCWQWRRLAIGDAASCLRLFKSNRDFGALVFAGLLATAILK